MLAPHVLHARGVSRRCTHAQRATRLEERGRAAPSGVVAVVTGAGDLPVLAVRTPPGGGPPA